MPNENTMYKPEDWEAHPGDLNVLEMYAASGQGEGWLTGVPSFFIRLAGCSIGCAYCDSRFTWTTKNKESNWMSAANVYDAAERSGLHHVIVTGGEPLQHRWEVLFPLLNRLSYGHKHVTVETSGAFGARSVSDIRNKTTASILWSVAPKLPHAKSTMKLDKHFLSAWTYAASNNLQFKFVYASIDDIGYVLNMVRSWAEDMTFPFNHPTIPFIFQPMTPGASPKADEEEQKKEVMKLWRDGQEFLMNEVQHMPRQILDNNFAVFSVRPQTHFFLYGHRRGV